MVLADLVTREYEFWENRHLDCIGDYELGRTVGRGSSGVVRAAIHVVTRRKFAVKIIKKGNCSDLSRLDREIQSLTVVQHPNVVSLEEVLDSEDNTFLVMTLCGGGSLIDIVRLYPEERMPEATARFYLRQLFDALAYCHANGICHRDVRLDNIMLGNSGVLKLTDFGHSGIYTPGWDLFSTSLVGSIFNLSPEQIAGRCYSGEKIDVWSAGVLVYCLLVGHPPFYDSDTRKLIDSITTGTFEIPSFVSPSAADFIRLMINVVPDDRPPLSTMRRHPWFLEGPENAPVMDVVTIPVDPLYKWRPDLAEMIMAGTIHEHNRHFHLSDTHNPKSCPADLRGQDWALKCLCPNMDIKFSVSLFTKEPTEMAVSTGRCPASRLRPPATPWARSGEPTPSPRLLLSEDLPSGRGLGAGESSPSLVTFARTDALELNSASRPTAFGSLAAHEEAERGGPLVNPIFSSLPSVDASAGATSSEREMSGSDCGLTTPSTRRASLLHTPYSSEANDVDAGSSPAFSLGNPAAVARRGPMDSPSEFTLSPSRLMRSTSAVHLASTSYLDLDAGTADLRLGGLGGGETSGGDGGTISSDYRSDLMHLLRRSCSMQDRGEFITGARLKMTTSRTTDAFPYYCRLQPPPPPPAPPPVPQFLHPSGTPLRTATGRLLRPTCTSDESFVGLDPSLVDAGLEGAGGGVKVESDDDGYEEDGEWSSDGSAERRGAERRSRRRRRRTSGSTPIPPGLAGDGSSMAIPVPSAAVVAEGGVAENCPGGSPSWTVLANSPVGPGIVDRLSKHPSKRFTALQQPRRAGGAARPGENGPALDAGLPSIREATSVHPGPAFPPDESSPETLPVVAPSGPRSVEPRSFLERLEEDDDFQPFLEVRLQEGESGLFLRICRKLKTICDTKLAGAAERQKLRAP
nr:SnRK [Neopyropia yezoensis]